MADNPSINIYLNRIDNRITFGSKTVYYLELLRLETILLLERTKNKITKKKNGENESRLDTSKVVLVIFNIVNNDFFPKNFNLEFSYIEVWFTYQNSKLLEIEDEINITLVAN